MKKKYLFACIILLSAGCKNRPQQMQTIASESVEKYENEQETITIPIDVKAFIDEEFNNDLDYKVHEKHGSICIEPVGEYFNLYKDSKRIELKEEDLFKPCGLYSYPIIELFIVNNTKVSLSIDVEVSKSQLDDFPYVYLYKNYDLSYCLPISNEAWSNWGDMILEYKILKKGENFAGNYDKKRIVPYFTNTALIDFSSDIRSMGLNESLIAPYVSISDTQEWLIKNSVHILRDNESIDDFCRNGQFHVNNFRYDEVENLFYPFEVSEHCENYYGYARLYGRISFTGHEFKKEFNTQILITFPNEGGASEGLNDDFNIQLEIDKNDYVKKLPYVTTIEPGGSERVRLHVRCDKSTHHTFIIKARNSNGYKITTQNIYMYYLNSRHSYMNMNSENINNVNQ